MCDPTAEPAAAECRYALVIFEAHRTSTDSMTRLARNARPALQLRSGGCSLTLGGPIARHEAVRREAHGARICAYGRARQDDNCGTSRVALRPATHHFLVIVYQILYWDPRGHTKVGTEPRQRFSAPGEGDKKHVPVQGVLQRRVSATRNMCRRKGARRSNRRGSSSSPCQSLARRTGALASRGGGAAVAAAAGALDGHAGALVCGPRTTRVSMVEAAR